MGHNKNLGFNISPSDMGLEVTLAFKKINLAAVLRINSQTLKAETGNYLLTTLNTYISAIGCVQNSVCNGSTLLLKINAFLSKPSFERCSDRTTARLLGN